MVSQQTKLNLQQAGYTVLPKPEGYSQLHTSSLVIHPDGRTLEVYDDFYAVEVDYEYGLLTEGMQFDVDISYSPFYPVHEVGDQFDYGIDIYDPSAAKAGIPSLVPGWWIFVFLVSVFLVTGLLACTVAYSELIIHPCQPSVDKLSSCMKLITEPNCSQTYVDICYDGDGDGVREGRIIKTDTDYTSILKWVAIAVVTIGVVYVAAKVLPGLLRKKEQPPPE